MIMTTTTTTTKVATRKEATTTIFPIRRQKTVSQCTNRTSTLASYVVFFVSQLTSELSNIELQANNEGTKNPVTPDEIELHGSKSCHNVAMPTRTALHKGFENSNANGS
mmetsp:Transcript_10563/g.21223  ORF Transcript_10563/g.21223 Transcript_10563/m.21223 type:complete len:109 (+) Transcript_10563:450-776(+)